MRRVLNPLLLAATLAALGSLVYSVSAMQQEQRQLKVAKEDAFDSIHALWRARAVSYWANSDESRYLLDHAQAVRHARDFFTKSGLLAKFSPATRLADLVNAERSGFACRVFPVIWPMS